MRNIWTIANREYRLYFGSPAAYMIAFMILLVVGILFYLNIQIAAVQQFAPGVQVVLGPLGVLVMLATPAITTRLLSDEVRMGTIELLLTAPVRDGELVVGKWLGGFLFMLTLIVITLVYPLVLNQIIQPGIDQGPMISGYLGLVLLVASMIAIGVMVSACFSNQIATFATTMGLLILLWWIIGPIAQTIGGSSGLLSEVVTYMDFSDHYYSNLMRGIIDLKDIVFYLSITALSLFLGTVAVEMRRWR